MGILTLVSGQLEGSRKMKSVQAPKLTIHVPILCLSCRGFKGEWLRVLGCKFPEDPYPMENVTSDSRKAYSI